MESPYQSSDCSEPPIATLDSGAQIQRPRKPWVAVLFSFLTIGLGHLYCGRFSKGIKLFFTAHLFIVFAILALLLPASNAVFIFLIVIPASIAPILMLYSMIDSYFIAKKSGADFTLKKYNRTFIYIAIIIAVMVYDEGIKISLKSHVLETFQVPPGATPIPHDENHRHFEEYLQPPMTAMVPTLRPGDRFLVNKLAYSDKKLKHGMLIAFNPPKSEFDNFEANKNKDVIYIKRVIALPGDTVEVKGREIIINGKSLQHEAVSNDETIRGLRPADEIFLETNDNVKYKIIFNEELSKNFRDEPSRNYAKTVIPTGSVFVMGDNRDRSADSRYFGPVPMKNIIGFAQYNYFPVDSWSRFGVIDD